VTTPPGWYPDPSNPSSQRWWDGQAWGAAQETPAAGAPSAPPTYGSSGYGSSGYGASGYGAGYPGGGLPSAPPATGYGYPGGGMPTPTGTVPPTLSWAIAATPVISILFHFSSSFAVGALGSLLTWIVSLVLASQDHKQLRAAGYNPITWAWAILGPFVYLLARAIRLRHTMRQPGWEKMAVAFVLLFLSNFF
jgi:hypothetical protein